MTLPEEPTQRYGLLLIDDEEALRFPIRRFFEARGYEVREAASVEQARDALLAAPPDVAIVDHSLPDGDGLELLGILKSADPPVPAIVLTGYGSIDLAIKAIKAGAEQFLTKPVEMEALALLVERLIGEGRSHRVRLARNSREARAAIDPFAGESPAMRRLAEQAHRLLAAASPILILGETGTGKGLLASWLRRNGPRSEEAFVDLNCSGLSREFLESEILGHEKGAFTGAAASKRGLLEVAHRGTLFLDEVGDLDLGIQPKLLKVLEEQRFRRLGDVRERQVDVRLIAATHHDLAARVEAGLFRADLFYRISALPLRVPSLVDRGDDVILLARSLLGKLAHEVGRPELRLGAEAERAIRAHRWPGNVRELRNSLERAALLAGAEEIRAEDLFPSDSSPAVPAGTGRSLEEVERRHIESVLREEGGEVEPAARVLGLSRSALYQRLSKHKIRPAVARRAR